jgi:prophage regulatory protein
MKPQTAPTNEVDRNVRLPELEKLLGVKKTTIYRLMAEDKLDQPLRLGPRLVAWRMSSVRAFLESLQVKSAK